MWMCRVGVVVFYVSLLCVTLSLSSFVFVHVDAGTVVEITSPAPLVQVKTTDRSEITPAVFGSPKYGGYVNGILFYPKDPKNRLGCFPIDVAKEKDLPTGESVSVIWMLDRSPAVDDQINTPDWNDVCSFVTKVRNAQSAGAIAVVIVNRGEVKEDGGVVDESLVYMSDDGTGRNVYTPAVMIRKSNTVGTKGLIEKMRTPDPKPQNPDNTKFVRIGMQISWTLPTTSGNVNWEYWTSAADSQSTSFKRLFGRADLELHNNTLFTPRYFYYGGDQMDSEVDCTAEADYCGDLCLRKGKYCHYDPDEKNGQVSFTGVDIILENLWQSCVWEYLNSTSGGEAHMTRNKWWGYVADFERECNTPAQWRSTTCRDTIMDRYGIDRTSVLACRNEDGCDTLASDSTKDCKWIQRDLDERRKKFGIFYLPTLVVNKEAIRGDISCYPPISTSTCNAMKYICQGYGPSTRPAVCTNSADGCNFWERRDCAGVCGGSSSVDRCGLCLGRDDGSRDRTCRDCNNEIFGNHTLDACGVCLEKTDVPRNSTCKDCLGVVHGTAEKDACGICQGDGKSCEKLSTGAIIAIVLAISGVVGGAIYLYMRRQQNRMRDDIDGILKQYLPLDGSAGGPGGGGGSGHIRPTQRLDGHDNL